MGYMTMTDERTPYRRMTVSEDALWDLRQAGRRLERYVEEFLEQIDLVLFPPAPARKARTLATRGQEPPHTAPTALTPCPNPKKP